MEKLSSQKAASLIPPGTSDPEEISGHLSCQAGPGYLVVFATVAQWFSTGGHFTPTHPEDICHCLETCFRITTRGGGEGCSWHLLGRGLECC